MPFKSKTIYELKKIEKIILDLIFPDQCFVCGKEGFLICPNCEKEIPILSEQVCPICENVFIESGKVCRNCKKENNFIRQMIAVSEYKDTSLPKIIHSYKYKFVSELSVPLGKILIRGILRNNLPIPDFLVPVPLHSFRLRWRGFNQSELLANYIGQNLLPGMAIPVLNNLIVRQKNTPAQMGIKNYRQRQENLKNAFSVNAEWFSSKKNLIKNKNILIVDDVCTTGSTIFSCAKLLKTLSPRSISAVVLARQRIS